MIDPTDTEKRLTDIEERLAHQDRTIQDLSDVLARQWRAIDTLHRDLERLEALLERALEPPGTPTDSGGSPPPFLP